MNKERSEWELKEKQNELAYQVTDAYYKLILERKLLDLALEQSRLSERYLKQTEVFVELGLKSASDLQEVKARREGDIYRYQSRGNSSRIAFITSETINEYPAGRHTRYSGYDYSIPITTIFCFDCGNSIRTIYRNIALHTYD